jgi:hypothetical protein
MTSVNLIHLLISKKQVPSSSTSGVETYLRFYYEFPPVDSPTQNMTMMIVTNQPYWFSFALGSNMATGDMWIFVINEAAYHLFFNQIVRI